MTLDTENQRTMLLQMIQASSVPGQALDDVYQLKQAIVNAEIKHDNDGDV